MSIAEEREIHCLISGKVQGVFYREFTKRRAVELGIKGVVRNLEDGTVEVIAQGEEEQLKRFVKLLKKGSTFTRVENIEVEWTNTLHDTFTDFTVE